MPHGIQDIVIMFRDHLFLSDFSRVFLFILQPSCWAVVLSVHHPVQHGASPTLAVQELQTGDLAHTSQLGSNEGSGNINHTRGCGGDYLLYLHSSYISGKGGC